MATPPTGSYVPTGSPATAAGAAGAAAATASPAGGKALRLQVRYNAARHTLSEVDPNTTFSDFQALVQAKTNLSVAKQSLLHGFPPKELVVPTPATTTLAALNIRNGDLIVVKVKDDDDAALAGALAAAGGDAKVSGGVGGAATVIQGKGWDWPSSIAKSGRMVQKEMPRDNSCLFHAIAYLCADGSAQSGSAVSRNMRELIANLVASDPATFNTAFLGSPNGTYQQTILNPDSWGGAIELSIFTRQFQTEIYAYDIHHLREDVYGAGEGYKRRVFVLYSGDHYDAIAWSPLSGTEQRVMSTKDEQAVARARSLVESLHSDAVAAGKAVKQSGFKSAVASKAIPIAERKGGHALGGAAAVAAGGAGVGGKYWSCEVCTYADNPNAKSECILCSALRPKTPGTSPAVTAGAVGGTAASAATTGDGKAKPTPSPPVGTPPSDAPRPKPPRSTPPPAGSTPPTGANSALLSGAHGGRETWTCPACTYVNVKSPSTTMCAMCSEVAPAQAQSAPEALIEPINPFAALFGGAALASASASGSTSGTRRTSDAKNSGARPPALANAGAGGAGGILIGPETGAGAGAATSPAGGNGWACAVCTMQNAPGTSTCGACGLPNPATEPQVYGQQPTAAQLTAPSAADLGAGRRVRPADAVAGGAGGGGGAARAPVAPVHTEQRGFFSQLFNPERSWKCESCGSAQLPDIIRCSNCKNPNYALIQRQAQGQGGDGACALM